MEPVRFFTPDEARAVVPRLRPLLAELRDAFTDYRFARQQVDELLADYDEDPADVPGHPMEREAVLWRRKASEADRRVRETLGRINELGADVKDPVLGLVDFYALGRDGETVLLCYRDDEETIRFWHPVETGFAGRRPLEEL